VKLNRLVILVLILLSVSTMAQAPRVVTAAEANGTYEYRHNEMKILALGHNQLRIQH